MLNFLALIITLSIIGIVLGGVMAASGNEKTSTDGLFLLALSFAIFMVIMIPMGIYS